VNTSSGSGGRPAQPCEHEQHDFDTRVAHPARVCNYWLGGKDHFEADRQAGEAVKRIRPQIAVTARANRHFMARAVAYLAGHGIRQFIDIGCGLPAPDNTHEIAQGIAPESRVVYVDNDPLVLAHARALLSSAPEGSCDYIDADIRQAGYILREAMRTLDFSQPVGLLFLAILQLIPDRDQPAAIVGDLAAALVAGSAVVISHMTADFAPGPVSAAVAAYNAKVPPPARVTARTAREIAALFGGLPLCAPGLVPVQAWRPQLADPLVQSADLYTGLARIGP
jgi:hypothetical protein